MFFINKKLHLDHKLHKLYKLITFNITYSIYLQVINKAFLKAKKVETKTCDIDLVTETDKEVEVLLIDGLKKAFPDHK